LGLPAVLGQSWRTLIPKDQRTDLVRRVGSTAGRNETFVSLKDLKGEERAFRLSVENDAGDGKKVCLIPIVDEVYVSVDLETGFCTPSFHLFARLGYSSGEYAEFRWKDALSYEDTAQLISMAQLASSSSPTQEFSYRLRTNSGGWKWFSVRPWVAQWSAAGECRTIHLIHEDVTRSRILVDAVKDSESRWEAVANGPVGITLVNSSGIVQFTNGTMPTFLESIAVGKTIGEVVHDNYRNEFQKAINDCLSKGTRTTVLGEELRTGPVLEHHIGPVKSEAGIESAVIFSFDVTARHRSEQNIKRQNKVQEELLKLHRESGRRSQNLSSLLQTAMEITESRQGLWFELADSDEVRASSKTITAEVKTLTGIRRSQLNLWEQVASLRQPYLVTSEIDVSDLLGVPKQGLGRSLAVPVKVDRGGGIFVVADKEDEYDDNDITLLQGLVDGAAVLVANQELEENNRLLREVMEIIPVSLVMTTPTTIIEYVNQHFMSLMEFGPSEVLGKSMLLIDSGLSPEAERAAIRHAMACGRSWKGEVITKKKNGQLLWESISISPYRTLSGEIEHFVWTLEDISERHRSEDALVQARKMDSVGQLAAGVAHDFNNLLTSALAMNQMLLVKIPEGDPLRIYPERIALAGKRAADLVSSLLSFGRRQRLEKEILDLRELLREESSLLTSMVKGSVQIVSYLDGPPVMIEADGGQISQVVLNLVSNSRDAMPSGGRIVLAAGEREIIGSGTHQKWAFFSVHDNGPGIADEFREKIFEPFFTTKDIGQGTGLGLSVVAGIVEQHHGKIVLESAPGHGSLFVVYLPLA